MFSAARMLQMHAVLKNDFYSMWQLEDNIFYTILLFIWDFFKRHIVAFFGASVLKEVRILLYGYNNSAMPIPKFQNKAIVC